MIKVIGWVDWDSNYPEALDGFCIPYKYLIPLIEEIKSKGQKFSGDMHQNCDKCCPLFSNGEVLHCTQRVWGDIMARCWEENYDDDKYAYTKWAWDVPDNQEICIPE